MKCHDTGVWHGVFTYNPSTKSGQIPGCSIILSVAMVGEASHLMRVVSFVWIFVR